MESHYCPEVAFGWENAARQRQCKRDWLSCPPWLRLFLPVILEPTPPHLALDPSSGSAPLAPYKRTDNSTWLDSNPSSLSWLEAGFAVRRFRSVVVGEDLVSFSSLSTTPWPFTTCKSCNTIFREERKTEIPPSLLLLTHSCFRLQQKGFLLTGA